MKALYFYLLIFLLAASFSCQKKKYTPSEVQNSPVFYFKADINNSPVSLTAGLNNYYMYSSVQHDSNNVYNFIADLKQFNCTNCTNRLKIQINDYKLTALNEPAQIDSSLVVRSYPLATGLVNTYMVQFQSFYNKTAASYYWDFGDGSSSTLASPVHPYANKGVYDVCLKIKGTNGCESSICNTQKIGFTNTTRTFIQASTSGQNNKITFLPTTSGQTPFKYLWDFGDGREDTLQNPAHTYNIPGSYPVRLKVTDGNNGVTLTNYNALTQTDPSSCAANYKIFSETPVTQNSLGLSQITVSWTDSNGIIYTSNNVLQASSSSFEIVSVEDYSNNENGQKTKKVHIRFKCQVYNGANFILIDNADAIICVAYQ